MGQISKIFRLQCLSAMQTPAHVFMFLQYSSWKKIKNFRARLRRANNCVWQQFYVNNLRICIGTTFPALLGSSWLLAGQLNFQILKLNSLYQEILWCPPSTVESERNFSKLEQIYKRNLYNLSEDMQNNNLFSL